MTSSLRTRRRRALAHQCSSCRRLWALRAVVLPTGPVITCRYCSAVRWELHARTQPQGSAS